MQERNLVAYATRQIRPNEKNHDLELAVVVFTLKPWVFFFLSKGVKYTRQRR